MTDEGERTLAIAELERMSWGGADDLVLPTCLWEHDADQGVWETGCDHAFHLTDGTPAAHGFRFCPFCGRPLNEYDGEDKDNTEDKDADHHSPLFLLPGGQV